MTRHNLIKSLDFSRKRMEVRTEGERILCTEEFGKKIYSMLRSQQFIPPEKLDKEKVKAMVSNQFHSILFY